MLRLVELSLETETAFWEFLEALKVEGDAESWLFEYKDESYTGIVEKLKHWKAGQSLPDSWVPATSLFLMRDEVIVGRSSLRHELNDFLRTIGGHIGYYVRSDQRRKGYGTEILRLTLEKAKLLGLDRVLVTCDEGNIASAKIIERNGGVLEDTYQENEVAVPKRRYWIDL